MATIYIIHLTFPILDKNMISSRQILNASSTVVTFSDYILGYIHQSEEEPW